MMIKFTAKENELLQYLVKGMNNKDIAEKMFTTTHTVKAHITSIMKKLNVTNRTAVVYEAIKNKIVDINND